MRRPGWPTVFFNPGWIGLSHPYVPYKVVDEPAVAVAENHQSVGLGARHGADAVLVRLPIHHRAVGQPDTEARSTEMQVLAGHCQLTPCHGFPALVGRLATHEGLGPVIGKIPVRGRHAGDGRRRLRRQLAQAALHVVKEPHQLLRPAQQCGSWCALRQIHALGDQSGRRFGNGRTLNELAQHPVMVQLGIVQVEMAGVVQQRGLPVQVNAHMPS